MASVKVDVEPRCENGRELSDDVFLVKAVFDLVLAERFELIYTKLRNS